MHIINKTAEGGMTGLQRLLVTYRLRLKFVPLSIAEIHLNNNLTWIMDNTKVKVNSYHGNQKNTNYIQAKV